jgi:hypothetical protein
MMKKMIGIVASFLIVLGLIIKMQMKNKLIEEDQRRMQKVLI